MINTKNKVILAVILFLIIAFMFIRMQKNGRGANIKTGIMNPVTGDVAVTVATTGVVKPQNRLEIKPSIGGRIGKILVKEGDRVKEGDTLAWMSSTERAALIDAARSQGEDALAYWGEAYKETPIISPIDGEVIVRSVEPGQAVTTSDAVLVLSDRLVVSAQFDETDIGKIKVGQKAFVMLDAYPDVKIEGAVDHIAYESEIVNNVTIYNVDILPNEVPEMLRSGMSVAVEVVEEAKNSVLTIPSNAIHYAGKRQFVLVKERGARLAERDITVGLNNEKIAEIISGLGKQDNVVVQDIAYVPTRKPVGRNPFMPFDGRRSDRTR